MQTLPLHFRDGHIFVDVGRELWLLDTGAPSSFGTTPEVQLAGEAFTVGSSYVGLTAESLSQFVGVQCVGLLGADVLGHLDHIFDTAAGRLTVSSTELAHAGEAVSLDEFMGIPVVTARVAGEDFRMFFDTGAQISYLQHDSLADYPAAGSLTDFYPGVGEFQTHTHEVPVSLGDVRFNLRCGTLPGLLGATLMMAGTTGIVGNEILNDRKVGYFPRRRLMVL